MKAVHLAAGKGTRLRPVTEDRPKPLVELGDQSLLERNVSTLTAAGVDEHLVVTGYRAGDVEDLGYETVHNERYDETEMIYSLFRAAPAFPDGQDLVISYGDIVYERSVARRLLACDAPMCIAVDRNWRDLWELRFADPLDDAEALELADDGRILSIGADTDDYADVDAQYTGLLKVRADHLDRFVAAYRDLEDETDGPVSVETTDFIQGLIDDGWDVRAVEIEGGWLEVDTLEDLQTYRDRLGSPSFSRLFDPNDA